MKAFLWAFHRDSDGGDSADYLYYEPGQKYGLRRGNPIMIMGGESLEVIQHAKGVIEAYWRQKSPHKPIHYLLWQEQIPTWDKLKPMKVQLGHDYPSLELIASICEDIDLEYHGL